MKYLFPILLLLIFAACEDEVFEEQEYVPPPPIAVQRSCDCVWSYFGVSPPENDTGTIDTIIVDCSDLNFQGLDLAGSDWTYTLKCE